MTRKRQQRLSVVHPDCAGIDIGSTEHWVSVPPDRATEPVCRFGTFTADLEALADWLKAMKVQVVAMEGVWLGRRVPQGHSAIGQTRGVLDSLVRVARCPGL